MLYHEVTFAKDLKERANQTGHSTSYEAASIANSSGAKNLLIGHFSKRYKDTSVLLKETKHKFTNTIKAESGLKLISRPLIKLGIFAFYLIKLKKKIFILFLLILSFVSKSQYLQTNNVINISCYEDGQIQTIISSLDTNNFSKWYYSNDLVNWLFIDQNDTNFILNNSNYNSDSILTSVCGHFKLSIVNVLDSILEENIFYVSCEISSQVK